MASNVTLNSGSGGAIAASAQISHDGDTAQLQLVGLMGISGTEDSYTVGKINGDATNGIDVDVTRVSGTVTVDGSGVTQPVSHSALTELGSALITEDVAHSTGDLGLMALFVRQDAQADFGADGDYVPGSIDADGNLRVAVGGTVTVGSHAVTNAGTFATQVTSIAAGDNNIGNVDVLTVPAPLSTTGGGTEATALRVTIANDSTGLVSIDDNGGSLTVDGTVTANLAAGTNNIGDVDVLTLPNVTLAAGTNTNEVVGDAAHDAAAAGNPILLGAYASAAAPADVSADADVVRLWALRNGSQVVNIAAAGALIGATANALDVNIKSGAGSGGTAMTDDAAFTPGTTSITPIGAMFDDVTPDSVNEGDGGVVRMSANRNMYVTVRDAAGNERGLNIDAAGSLAVTNAGTFAVQNTAQASTNTQEIVGDAAHDAAAAGNPLLMGAYASAAAPSDVSADADAVRLWALRNGSQVVNLAYGGTLVTASTVQESVGDVADDAAAAGNPVLIGGNAVETDGTDPTQVSAEADAAMLRTDRQRNLLVNITHPRLFRASADYASAQTNTSVQAAPGASLSLYITDVIISNGATAGNITLLDGSGGTVLLEIYPAINGGVAHSFRNPLRLTANTALCITSTTVTTHSVTVTGYIAP